MDRRSVVMGIGVGLLVALAVGSCGNAAGGSAGRYVLVGPGGQVPDLYRMDTTTGRTWHFNPYPEGVAHAWVEVAEPPTK